MDNPDTFGKESDENRFGVAKVRDSMNKMRSGKQNFYHYPDYFFLVEFKKIII